MSHACGSVGGRDTGKSRQWLHILTAVVLGMNYFLTLMFEIVRIVPAIYDLAYPSYYACVYLLLFVMIVTIQTGQNKDPEALYESI